MSYEKQYFADGQTLTAAQLNHMEEGIAAAAGVKGDPGDKGEKGDPGEGLTPNAKQLLLTLFENAAYKTGDGQPTLNALRTEWGFSVQPDVPVQSVSLSAAELTLNEGESQTLTVTVLPANATGSVAFSISAGGFATAGNPVKLRDSRKGRHLYGKGHRRRQKRPVHSAHSDHCRNGNTCV